MQKSKQNWDTRAWLIGIVGGLACGGIAFFSVYVPFQQHLDSHVLPFVGHRGAEFLTKLASLFCLLVLPGLLSGLAQRQTFYWGLLPVGLFLIAGQVEVWLENGIQSVVKDWWLTLAVFSGCVVISSGPVSLFRWLRARGKRHQEAQLRLIAAQQEAAAVPREGVWPPPPEYMG